MTTTLILHPERTDDPQTVRSVIPAGLLDFVGSLTSVPQRVAALLDDGTLTAVRAEPSALLTSLAPGRQWRLEGERVRGALEVALGEPGWSGVGGGLAVAVNQVIAGDVGDYLRSHGGSARLVGVEGDDAIVELMGACGNCPARGLTLELRFASALRRLYPKLGRVRLSQASRRH